ncbi:hypothetical protein BKA61DRAFT_478575, partial [Leptodontidium sp. MPI-SDFR-AT-0119]
HTARKARLWFKGKRITLVVNWPPFSLNLNPIKHVWWHLKKRLYDIFPDVAADKSQLEYARKRIESCL